jgi:hypothetical protein
MSFRILSFSSYSCESDAPIGRLILSSGVGAAPAR